MGGPLSKNAPLCRMIQTTAAELGYKVFVETGANRGKSSFWAAGIFEDVITIESDKDKYDQLVAVLEDKNEWKEALNVHAYWGDAGKVLPRLLHECINEPALFWLDAHNPTDRPPIRETLHAILSHPFDHIIYIDDAQYYWMQCYVDWPGMDELRDLLEGYALALVSDAMIAYPPRWSEFLRKIARAERRSSFVCTKPMAEWGEWQ